MRAVYRLRGGLAALARGRRDHQRELPSPPSVKDGLEALGVPHTEVDRLVAAGRELEWGDPVPDGIVVEAWPVPPAVSEEAGGDEFARPVHGGLQLRPLARDRFLCDLHLGTLARLLRMLGLDTAWERSGREAEMARRATAERRAVLTGNRKLLMRGSLTVGLLLLSHDPNRQAVSVLRRFGYDRSVRRFTRCSQCNGRLDERTLDQVRDKVPPRTARWLDEYYLCRDCGQLFWEGTHVTALRRRLDAIVSRASNVRPPDRTGNPGEASP